MLDEVRDASAMALIICCTEGRARAGEHVRASDVAFDSRFASSAAAASKRISVSSSGEMDWVTATSRLLGRTKQETCQITP